jgi:signal transduction histidine kinase
LTAFATTSQAHVDLLAVGLPSPNAKIVLAELELALINLVANARHAMPKGGALTVPASNASAATDAERPMVSLR